MTFYKRHKILSAIFFISIILLIKNSSIPYIFEPPAIISYIFDSPKSNFWDNVAQMSNIFTSAYVTSLMFYYMVDYLPTTIYLWLISLTSSKELSILLLKLLECR